MAQDIVALLAEGVDRNSQICEWAMAQDIVALLAEGVDRNKYAGCTIVR